MREVEGMGAGAHYSGDEHHKINGISAPFCMPEPWLPSWALFPALLAKPGAPPVLALLALLALGAEPN